MRVRKEVRRAPLNQYLQHYRRPPQVHSFCCTQTRHIARIKSWGSAEHSRDGIRAAVGPPEIGQQFRTCEGGFGAPGRVASRGRRPSSSGDSDQQEACHDTDKAVS